MTHLTKCVSFSLILISLMGFVMVPTMMGAVAIPKISVVPQEIPRDMETPLTISLANTPLDAAILMDEAVIPISSRTVSKVVMLIAKERLGVGPHSIVAVTKAGVRSNVASLMVLPGSTYYKGLLAEGELYSSLYPDWSKVQIGIKQVNSADETADIRVLEPDAGGVPAETVTRIKLGGAGTRLNTKYEMYARIPRAETGTDLVKKYEVEIGFRQALPRVEEMRKGVITIHDSAYNVELPDGSEWAPNPDSLFPKRINFFVAKDTLETELAYQDGDIYKTARLKAGDKWSSDEECRIEILRTEYVYGKGGITYASLNYSALGNIFDEGGAVERDMRKDLDIMVVNKDAGESFPSALMFRGMETETGFAVIEVLQGGSRRRESLKVADINSYIEFITTRQRVRVALVNPEGQIAKVIRDYMEQEINLAATANEIAVHKKDKLKLSEVENKYMVVEDVDFEKKLLWIQDCEADTMVRRFCTPLGGSFIAREFLMKLVGMPFPGEARLDITRLAPASPMPMLTAVSPRSRMYGGTPIARSIQRIFLTPENLDLLAGGHAIWTPRHLQTGFSDGSIGELPLDWKVDFLVDRQEFVESITQNPFDLDELVKLRLKPSWAGSFNLMARAKGPGGEALEAARRVNVWFPNTDRTIDFSDRKRFIHADNILDLEKAGLRVLDRAGKPVPNAIWSVSTDRPDLIKVVDNNIIRALAEGGPVKLIVTHGYSGGTARLEHEIHVLPPAREVAGRLIPGGPEAELAIPENGRVGALRAVLTRIGPGSQAYFHIYYNLMQIFEDLQVEKDKPVKFGIPSNELEGLIYVDMVEADASGAFIAVGARLRGRQLLP